MALQTYFGGDYEKLQVVMSHDSDFTYNLHCLPAIINKKYMNTHLFKGKDHPYVRDEKGELLKIENEVFKDAVRFPLFERQLFELFESFHEKGVEYTFLHLSDHAKYVVTNTVITRHLRNLQHGSDIVFSQVHQFYDVLLGKIQQPHHELSLLETVAASTLQLLGYDKRSRINN